MDRPRARRCARRFATGLRRRRLHPTHRVRRARPHDDATTTGTSRTPANSGRQRPCGRLPPEVQRARPARPRNRSSSAQRRRTGRPHSGPRRRQTGDQAHHLRRQGPEAQPRARQRHDHSLHVRLGHVPAHASVHPPRCASPATAQAIQELPRPARPCGVQNLHYTYDPVGNITHIQDDAQQTIFFANQQVEPSNDYVYDAVYRLIEGTGRENGSGSRRASSPRRRLAERGQSRPPIGHATTPSVTATTASATSSKCGTSRRATSSSSRPDWTQNYRYESSSNRLLETWLGRTDPDRWARQRHVRLRPARQHAQPGQHLTNAGPALGLERHDPHHRSRWRRAGLVPIRRRQAALPQVDRPRSSLNGTISEERIYLDGYERYRRYTGDPNDPVEEIESHHLFEGEQRVLLVDDVLKARDPRPDKLRVTKKTLWRYQYGNHLGSVGLELDEGAQVISYEEFHPYGTSAYRLMNAAVEAPPKRYRYTGMERDEESGLNYQGARFYDVRLGRWTSCDPILMLGGVDPYVAMANAPTTMHDPKGTSPAEPGLGYRGPPEPLNFGIPDEIPKLPLGPWEPIGRTAPWQPPTPPLEIPPSPALLTAPEAVVGAGAGTIAAGISVLAGLAVWVAFAAWLPSSTNRKRRRLEADLKSGTRRRIQEGDQPNMQFPDAHPSRAPQIEPPADEAGQVIDEKPLSVDNMWDEPPEPIQHIESPAIDGSDEMMTSNHGVPKQTKREQSSFISQQMVKKYGSAESWLRVPLRGALHDHHLLSQEFQTIWVARFDLNIENYKIWLLEDIHLNHFHGAGRWNPTWKEWLYDPQNVKATQADVIARLQDMWISWEAGSHSFGKAAPK